MKYEQVRAKLPPFISQRAGRLARGGVPVDMCARVRTHLGRRSPGPQGSCMCVCAQAVPACLGRARGASVGVQVVVAAASTLLHVARRGGQAVHSTQPRAVPMSSCKAFMGTKLLSLALAS